MSSFIVTKSHIRGILQATRGAYHGDRFSYYWRSEGSRVYVGNGPDQVSLDELGQKLWDENYRSVYNRYQDRVELVPTFRHKTTGYLEPVELLKLLEGYAYQACECDDWQLTEAYAIVQALQGVAIRRLEGYEDSNWTI